MYQTGGIYELYIMYVGFLSTTKIKPLAAHGLRIGIYVISGCDFIQTLLEIHFL